jgi:hypothetical protein
MEGLERAAVTESGLSPALRAGAPHLERLLEVDEGPYLKETYRLRRLFEPERDRDEVVELLQRHKVEEPLPKAIWRDIVQDKMVPFDKINGAFDRGYDFTEAPKDVGGGYSLIKTETIPGRKAVRTEAEWLRCYDAWSEAVLLVYPHRRKELAEFCRIVCGMFHQVPEDPALAMQFDTEVRERYAKKVFRIDSRADHNTSFLSQLVAAARSAGAFNKRGGVGELPTAKRGKIICENWNLGKCEDLPCRSRRWHGDCSECGERHRALDIRGCVTKLRARRQKLFTDRDASRGPPPVVGIGNRKDYILGIFYKKKGYGHLIFPLLPSWLYLD